MKKYSLTFLVVFSLVFLFYRNSTAKIYIASSNNVLSWNDLCYTGDSSIDYNMRRSQLINQTLNILDRNNNRKNKYVAEHKTPKAYPQNIYKNKETNNQDSIKRIIKPDYSAQAVKNFVVEKTLDEFYPKMNELELSTGAIISRYKESSLMKNQGALFILSTSITHRIQKNKKINSVDEIFSKGNKLNVFKLEAELGAGEVDYKSSGTGSLENEKNFFLETRGILGIDAPISDSTVLMPYFGIGYRYLKNDSAGMVSTTGASGYLREQHYVYIPLGIDLLKKINKNVNIAMKIEYDYLTYGKQQTHLTDTIDFTQKHGFGLRSSLKISKIVNKTSFFIQPFVRYWSIENSDIVAGYIEPKNDTLEYGFNLGSTF